jgi:hypothetical protein
VAQTHGIIVERPPDTGVLDDGVAPTNSSPDRWLVVPLLRIFFGSMYADMTRMEQVLRDSDLDFTIMRPPQLTNKRATGQYRTAINRRLPRARKISRADLAAEMLRVIPDRKTVRATVTLSY